MRLPSTPALFASVASSSVPCGSDAFSRKSLQPYAAATVTISAAPNASGCLDAIFMSLPCLGREDSLERGGQAKAERSVAGVAAAVDAAVLIPDVAGGARNVCGGQRWIGTLVARNGEQV